jgi:hypothetical protein
MSKSRFSLSLIGMLCISIAGFAQTLTTNWNRNVYPTDITEANKDLGLGRVGIGPTFTTPPPGLQTFIDPQELLHIHGWNPVGGYGANNTYMEPTIRLSLEEDIHPSRLYGFLTLRNKDMFGTGVNPKPYSAISQNKYDLILGTSYDINPTYQNAFVLGPGPDLIPQYVHPYNYDLILASNNPRGSIRFSTTQPPPRRHHDVKVYQDFFPNGNPNDVERMTILNTGNVGIANTDPKALLHIGERITFNGGEWAGMGYNQFFDVADPNPANWTERRMFDGAAGGIGGIPQNTPPGNILGRELHGGISMWAGQFEDGGTVPATGHSNVLWLSSGKLELWHDGVWENNQPRGVAFRVVTDMPADVEHDIPAKQGWAYFKNKVLIGEDGIDDPNYKDPNFPWPEPTGELDLTNLGTEEPLRLAARGLILCKELLVRTTSPIPWPDYVFDAEHALMPLEEVEQFVQVNKHLPDIPTAKDIQEKGVNVVNMQAKLLQKIEELTLYVIELKKENQELRSLLIKD